MRVQKAYEHMIAYEAHIIMSIMNIWEPVVDGSFEFENDKFKWIIGIFGLLDAH